MHEKQFLFITLTFPSSSRVWNGLWLSSMSYSTNPSWIFPGKMDPFYSAQARKREVTHRNMRPPRCDWGLAARATLPSQVWQPGQMIHERAAWACLWECQLLCFLLCWHLPLENTSSGKLTFGEKEYCGPGFTSFCNCTNQISIKYGDTFSASQWPHLDVNSVMFF